MRLGRAIRISASAEQDWQSAREMPSDTEQRLIEREKRAYARQGKTAASASVASSRHISKRKARR
jgi:hypothetical protein